mmetsp:Transcript_19753/g.26701  ORF Transcript_19753/g.26701 Transcript_19753/m.26701 type:complete len:146 (+) Transcript_19753:762-1199(+)
MVLFPDKMLRTCVLLKPWLLLLADFYTPGYLLVDCKTRRLVYTLQEANPQNKECSKIEKLPFYDYDTLPYVVSLTSSGLNLINVKARQSFVFRAGTFKDFSLQTFGEVLDPVGRLLYSQVRNDGSIAVEQLPLTQQFYNMLRTDP